MLKIYSFDEFWAGGTVVVATSLEDAIVKFNESRPWIKHREKPLSLDDIEVHEIKEGTVIDFMGDQ